MILHASMSVKRLGSGIDRGLQLELLARLYLDPVTSCELRPAFAAEREALENLDVPRFSVRSDSRDLELGSGRATIRGFFASSAMEELFARVQRLDLADLREEITVIRGSLGESVTSFGPAGSFSPMGAEEMMAAAEIIAGTIAARVVVDEDGLADWYGLTLVDASGEPELAPLGPCLYEGISGIALFLSALDFVRGNIEYRGLALGAMKVAASQALVSRELPIGAATGLASVIYALVRVSEFANAPELLDLARDVAAEITPARIAADQELDVLSGCAGAILGLLALYYRTDDANLLGLARTAGDRLLGGPEQWHGRSEQTLSGMSHGAAGIAYALVRLAAATGDERYRDAARCGVEDEAGLFSEEDGNWRDLRPSAAGHAGFRTSWCHGAPGIGLARLGGLPYLDSPQVRRDI